MAIFVLLPRPTPSETPSLSDSDADLLGVMREALQRIALYIVGCDEAAFLRDQRTIDAVALNILVVGECANRLSPDGKVALPAPWARIIAFRNRIAHGYASVSAFALWDVAVGGAPALAAQLDARAR